MIPTLIFTKEQHRTAEFEPLACPVAENEKAKYEAPIVIPTYKVVLNHFDNKHCE